MTSRQKGLLCIFLYSVLTGANATVTKIGLTQIPTLSFSFLRFFLASLAILPLHLMQKKSLSRRSLRLIPFSLLGTANIAFFVAGIKLTTATAGQLIYAGAPLLTTISVYLFFRHKLSPRQLLGVVVGFIGISLVVLLPVLEKGKPFAGDIRGNMTIILAVLSWSIYVAWSKPFQNTYSPGTISSAFIYVTMFALLPGFAYELYQNPTWWQALTVGSYIALAYMAIISTVIAYFLNQYAVKHGGSVFASLSLYLSPIVSYFFAFALLGEQLTPGLIVGGMLALIGVFFATHK